jgi:hypothetical protein
MRVLVLWSFESFAADLAGVGHVYVDAGHALRLLECQVKSEEELSGGVWDIP